MRYVSASELASHSTEYSSLLSIAYHCNTDCDRYFDHFLDFSDNKKSHEDTCKKLKNKLVHLFDTTTFTFNDSHATNLKFPQKPIQLLFVKSDIQPDVFLNCCNTNKLFTFLQFEVHSARKNTKTYNDEEYCSTIRKLASGLAEQLRCLRQIDPEQLILCGFYVPTGFFCDKPIEVVKCEWNENTLEFQITCYPYRTERELIHDLEEIFHHQKRIFEQLQLPDREGPTFVIPLTSGFLRNIGTNAKQLPSGESFVILDSENKRVYKYPFFKKDQSNLLNLLLTDNIELAMFPINLKQLGMIVFFEFKACPHHPLTREQVKRMFDNFIFRSVWLNGVISAIKALHNLGRAHLDIRLPNICYGENFTPILVDMDRSIPTAIVDMEVITGLSSQYKTDMYTIDVNEEEDIKEQIFRIDFKQLAILIFDILDPSTSSSIYCTCPPNNIQGSHKFLQKLYNGYLDIDDGQFDDFLGTPTTILVQFMS